MEQALKLFSHHDIRNILLEMGQIKVAPEEYYVLENQKEHLKQEFKEDDELIGSALEDWKNGKKNSFRFRLITINSEETVKSVLKILQQNKIKSAPVIEEYTNDIIGSIDILDIVLFCTAKLYVNSLTLGEMLEQIDDFLSKPVKHIIELSGRNHWKEISFRKSILELIELLSTKDIHRVAIVDDENKVIALLTQLNIIRFIQRHIECLYSIVNQTIEEWFIWKLPENYQVQTINWNSRVIDAFYVIGERQVSGIAVVNDEGVLVGNISASNMQDLDFNRKDELIRTLNSSLRVFMKLDPSSQANSKLETASNSLTRNGNGNTYRVKEPHVAIALTKSDTMKTVIEILTAKKFHRIFVVDSQHKPIAVISLSDIISQFSIFYL